MVKYIRLIRDVFDILFTLPDAEAGQIIKAIYDYGFEDIEPNFDNFSRLGIAWNCIKPLLILEDERS